MDEQIESSTTRKWWKRGVWGAVCIVAAVGVLLWATGSSASAASGYRTAEASVATVRQTLSISGTTEPVHQASAAFQVAGTVSTVDATAGEQVTAGQTLASLDTTSLTQAVSSAQLSVSAAEATLSENEAGQSAGSSSGGSGGGVTTASLTADLTSAASAPTGGIGSPTGSPSAQPSTITADQQAVVAAQKTEDADSATAAADFAQAQAVCTSTGGGTTTTTTPPSTTTPTTTTSEGSTACSDALSASLTDQEQVTADQKAVADRGERARPGTDFVRREQHRKLQWDNWWSRGSERDHRQLCQRWWIDLGQPDDRRRESVDKHRPATGQRSSGHRYC